GRERLTCVIDSRFQSRRERPACRSLGAASACRGHHPRMKLFENSFSEFTTLFGMLQIDAGPGKPSRLEPVVMATGTILIDKGSLRCSGGEIGLLAEADKRTHKEKDSKAKAK